MLDSQKPLPPQERDFLVSLAEGNPGRAFEMLSQGNWKAKLQEAAELLERMECSSEEELFSLSEELSRREDLQEIIAILLLIFRRRFYSRLFGVSEAVLLNMFKPLNIINRSSCAGSKFPGVKLTAGLLSLEKTCHALLQLQNDLLGNVNRRLALEVFLLTMRGVV